MVKSDRLTVIKRPYLCFPQVGTLLGRVHKSSGRDVDVCQQRQERVQDMIAQWHVLGYRCKSQLSLCFNYDDNYSAS